MLWLPVLSLCWLCSNAVPQDPQHTQHRVEIEPPFNLTYKLMTVNEDKAVHKALVSWQHPLASDVQPGPNTLVHELRFREVYGSNNWRVKSLLQEPHLELLDLPAGTYEVMVRCRSKDNNIWSKWSSPLLLTVPPRQSLSPAVGSPVDFLDAGRPYIHYCRSPSMETFTCWWHPLDNSSHRNDVTYSLTYTIGKGPVKQCPDYMTGGPNSCYFDKAHTVIWEVYCMNVTARSQRGVFTSKEHCLDVADIVEIDPPFNLTYMLMNMSDDESGRTVLVSWQYPIASEVNIGWITLVYELRFRQVSESNNWKVKGLLREPHLELLDLPAGTYEVMVRCRSKNNNIWSKWSSPLLLTVPPRQSPSPARLLALILVTGVGIMTFLIIGFGVTPQGKRIKAFLLPPIPKPLIRGIDPLLLKKGKIDEINRHLSSFHGYRPPQYCEESWTQVSLDEDTFPQCTPLSHQSDQEGKTTPITQRAAFPEAQQLLQTNDTSAPYCQGPTVYDEGPAPYSDRPLEVDLPTQNPTWVWPAANPGQPEMVSFPGMDYSMILNSTPASSSVPPNPQDFYTCVNGVAPSGTVHLVPCLPDLLKNSPSAQLKDDLEEGSEKSSQLAAFLEKQAETLANGYLVSPVEADTEQSEFAVPLLPQSTDRN